MQVAVLCKLMYTKPMVKQAIIFYGKPGSGKGTQADLVADQHDAVHFDTGRHLEAIVHDPKNEHDPKIQEQKKLFDTGGLLEPAWVLEETKRKVQEIHASDLSVVFSGSPRTMFEAEGLTPVLIELYGKENVFVFVLDVSDDVAIRRNTNRLRCSFCGAPLLMEYYPVPDPKYCPRCGGDLYKRTLDNPEVMQKRLVEYRERTEPIFPFMESQGIALMHINGEQKPFEVFRDIDGYFIKDAK